MRGTNYHMLSPKKSFIVFVLLFIKIYSYSQNLHTKELTWIRQDSIESLVFKEKNKINEWGKIQFPFSSVFSKDFSTNEINFNVIIVEECSGLPCWSIYIFTEKKGVWQLIAKTNATLKEQLMLDIDYKKEMLIFKTISSKIGELSFETLLLKHKKIE